MSALPTNMTRRRFAQLIAAGGASVACAGVLSACGGNGADGSPSANDAGVKNQVIVAMNMNSEPAAGFDPFVSWGCGEHVHEPLIQSTLITTDVNLEFVNDLATEYYCADDGMTWSFTIRDDAKFTDGEPLSASDVAFTINGIIESEAAEADLSMVEKATATDDTHVEIAMTKPYNALLYTLAVVGIVPEHAHGEDYGAKPIGSGRYMLEQWDRGQQVILKANEGYELFACETVDSRGISLPSIAAGQTKADGANEYPAGNDVTCDLAVRRAINYGVDRQAMIDNVLNGYGTPAYSVCDSSPWGSSDMKVETDVEAAKKLLDEAGWASGEDGVRSKDGIRAAFDMYYASDDSVRQALAAEFADQMKELGIEVSIKGASWDDIYPHEFSTPILWGWGSNAPTELYELTYSQGWGNYACYDNAEIDSYLDEALAVPYIEDSYELFQKAQWDGTQGVAPQGAATWVWLANVDHLYFKRTGLEVAEQKPHPHGHGWSLVNNVDQWSWA